MRKRIDLADASNDTATMHSKLPNLIEEYGKLKMEMKRLESREDELKTAIKEEMRLGGMKSSRSDNFSATYSVRRSERLDEAPMIEWMKSSGVASWAIKTKEYIDTDELESAIYSNKLSQDEIAEMNKFKIVTETSALTVRPRKGGK